MSLYQRTTEKRRLLHEIRMRDDEFAVVLGKARPMSPKAQLEQEKKVRREIANSNERRRMQSINAGFTSLKSLIPHHEGEKLSKAAILTHTTDYISNLEEEKMRLQSQNNKLKCMLEDLSQERDVQDSPPPKRKKRDTESSDEGISLSVTSEYGDDSVADELRREISELRSQLEHERRMRMILEEQNRALEAQLYPDRLRQIASQVQMQMKLQQEKERAMIEEKIRLEEQEKQMSQTTFSHSMSRRNLETIVEAIRHLEGDRVVFEEKQQLEVKHIAHSEESERETSSLSDPEDTKSESSGRDSPVNFHYHHIPTSCPLTPSPPAPHPQHQLQASLPQTHTYVEKYPVAVHLLHRPLPPFYHRPGVIVHKS
ncbi:transcription factor AP-4-like isoform X2 [Liolophura sinensis]|uniref:transcription factor AP-4-like isoform X2 n=1 Tax=Liolophura sinensis TaxID=3198878 RepID=UPI003158E099